MMSKNLARLLTVVLVNHIDSTTSGMDTSSMEAEKIEQMFINNNFTSIEYWVESKLKKK